MLQSIVDCASAALGLGKDTLFSTSESVQGLASRAIPGRGSTTSLYVLACVAAWAAWSRLRRRHAPPGPPRLPLLGNTFQLLLSPMAPCMLFEEWGKKYGPVFSIDLPGQHIVVLNSQKSATDLLERRSAIYSDRPKLVMIGEILTGGMFMVFSPYGPVWRKMRRAMHESFNLRAVEVYQPIQAEAAALTVSRLLAESEQWEEQFTLFSASSILSSVYGMPASNSKTPLIKHLEEHITRLVKATLGPALILDLIPVLNYIPAWMARWKHEGIAWHERETRLFEGLVADVAEKMAAGRAEECFASKLIVDEGRHGLSSKEMAWVAGIMADAGTETTATSLLYFVLAMVLNPEVMRKAQKELDAVVGFERPPTFGDRANLPYICAMVKETLRWRTVAPLAVPHRSIEDDWYEGYFIPKGTTVIGNVWAMNRDPSTYPDFDTYRPERFLDETETVEIMIPDTHDLGHLSFGFGRRCVGLHFADQALFITIATTLWATEIKAPVDENGNAVLPDPTALSDTGIVVRPAPFPCQFTPRFPQAQEILKESRVHK